MEFAVGHVQRWNNAPTSVIPLGLGGSLAPEERHTSGHTNHKEDPADVAPGATNWIIQEKQHRHEQRGGRCPSQPSVVGA